MSRNVWKLALAALFTGQIVAAAAQEPVCARSDSLRIAQVTAIPDVRTVQLDSGETLRPAGLESFLLLVPGMPGAEAALLQRLRTLLLGTRVQVQPVSSQPDRYGRTEALVYSGDHSLLQEVMIGEGLAIAVPAEDPLPCFARLLRAEATARERRLGMWGGDLAQVSRAVPKALNSRIGRFTILAGTVISVGTRPNRTYLNFGRNWSEDVTVSIENRDREAFGGEAALEMLAGQRVRVRGFLEAWSGPAMTLHSPDQLEVLGTGPAQLEENP